MTNRKFFFWHSIGLVALMLIVYHSLFSADFVRWDDDLLVLDNPIVHSITPWTLWKIFTTYDPELYIPFTLLSYQLNAVLGGLNPFSYHATNMILHLGSAITLTGITILLTNNKSISAFVGALFVIHPLNTEAVAWISARKDVLSVLFFLLSILCYLLFKKKEDRRWLTVSLICFVSALLSKIIVVTLPAVLLLIDWRNGRMLSKKNLYEKIPFFGASIVFAVIALGGKTGQVGSTTMIEVSLMAIRSTAFYLKQLFVPLNFSVIYPETHSIAFNSPIFLISTVVVVLLTVMFIALWKRSRIPLLCWLFFLGTLAPSFVLYRKGFDGGDIYFASDRYAYIPMIGIILLVALLFHKALQRWKYAYESLGMTIVIILSVLTYHQGLVWKSSETLFTHALQLYPTAHAIHSNFGMVKYGQGRLAGSERHFKEAIAIRPVPNAYANLGALYREQKRWDESLAAYQESLKLSSSDYDTQFGLGVLFAQRREYEKAESFYKKAIIIEPTNATAYLNLGGLYAQQQRWQDALTQYQLALKQNPFYANAYFNMGSAYKRLDRTEEAREAFIHALRYNPNLEPAKAHLREL